jgi:hypothetical protein
MKDSHKKLTVKFTQVKSSIPLKQTIFLLLCLCSLIQADALTLPINQRPDWLQRDGIVMAGSWEPLLFRVRRDGSDGYTPTTEQRNAYLREHSPEMIARLKDLGVNFIMMHCYKGAGLSAERESMADAVKFSKLCHDSGLRVGVYNYSGAFLWEPLFKEIPQAKDWVLLDEIGKPRTYVKATYRYYWNRNHPDAKVFYKKIVCFAVNEIKADLLHFDNYIAGPGCDHNSVQRFRQYLRNTYTQNQLKSIGIENLDTVQPPMTGSPDNLLHRAWLEFTCKSLADSYHEMSRYARTLRNDILIECNPGGPGNRIRAPVDHGRLLQSGEAFWDEGSEPGYRNGQLYTHIRTYKVARSMNNMAFTYTTTPLEMAESMAFNHDCLGCICWFEYAKIVARPGSEKVISPTLEPFIRFYHTNRDIFRKAKAVADVAVLRSFSSQVFADSHYAKMTYEVEQTLINNHVCFQIIYDQQLDNLERYRVLVLSGCIALSDQHIKQIEKYVECGGCICIIGPVATHDEWMRARERPVFDQLGDLQAIHISSDDDIVEAIQKVCDNELTLSIHADSGLCSELTEQPGRRLVHLVNYRKNYPINNVLVNMRLPAGYDVDAVLLRSPERDVDIDLLYEEEGERVKFIVPTVNLYEIATIQIK